MGVVSLLFENKLPRFDKRDIELCDAIVKTASIKEAALSIGMSPSAAYNRGHKIKHQVLESRTFVNRVLAQSRRSPELKRFLWPRVDADLSESKKEV